MALDRRDYSGKASSRPPGDVRVTKSLGSTNLIPEKYRRLIRTVETNIPVSDDYEFPTGLTGDQTQIVLLQAKINDARLKVTEQIINANEDPLIGGKTGEFGNLIINEEIVDEGTAPLVDKFVQSSDVTPLGNGKSIRITVKYPDDFFDKQKVSKSIGQDNLIPEKYRRLVKHIETEKPVPVDYTFPTGLTGDETRIEFIQSTITEARLKILEEVINTDETPLLGAETDEFGPLVINESIVEEGTPVDDGFGVKKSTVTPLGNGKSIKITVKLPTNRVVGLILVTNQGSGYTSAPAVGFSGGGGTGATATALVLNGKVFAVMVTNGGTGYTSAPTIAFTGGGGTGAAATAILGLAALQGQEYDPEFDVGFPTIETEIAAGAGIGAARTDIKPIDYLRSRAKTVDASNIAILDNYVLPLPNVTDIRFPPVLEGISAFVEVQSGEGDATEAAGSAFWDGHGSWTVNPTSETQSSIVAMPDASPLISQKWARNIDTTFYLFFMRIPFTRADAIAKLGTLIGGSISPWPKYNPKTVTVFCVGGKASVMAKANVYVHDGGSDDSDEHAEKTGDGASREVGISIKAIRIPETIHGLLAISGFGSDSYEVAASAYAAEGALVSSRDLTAGVDAYVSIEGEAATPGDHLIPSSGLYLLGFNGSTYKYGYARVRAEVLDAADL